MDECRGRYKEFRLLMIDPEGLAPVGVAQWVAYGIPASVTEFAEGEVGTASNKYIGGKSTLGVGLSGRAHQPELVFTTTRSC